MNKRRIRKFMAAFGLTLLGLLLVLAVLAVMVSFLPGESARFAGQIRRYLGPRPVAWMETAVFTTQDLYHQLAFGLGWERVQAPWEAPVFSATRALTPVSDPAATIGPAPSSASTPEEFRTAMPSRTPVVLPSSQPSATAIHTSAPTIPPPFTLAALPAGGSLAGEGIWEPYLLDPAGKPYALRTFLQPDPKRSYAILSLVAFDLRTVRLHFALGFVEPRTAKFRLSGAIPAEDRIEGRLLAAFNGGFLPAHGGYGAMADGILPIAPRDGLATIAIDREGRVSLGEWGSSILDSPDWQAWRQNGPLVIADGQVSAAVKQDIIALWGGTIDGNIVTWRSAVGLSQNREVLYYAVGSAMGIGTLAEGLRTAGVDAAMQLDINASWTNFIAVRFENGQPIAVPLLKEMIVNPGRYLKPSARDFFYLTAR